MLSFNRKSAVFALLLSTVAVPAAFATPAATVAPASKSAPAASANAPEAGAAANTAAAAQPANSAASMAIKGFYAKLQESMQQGEQLGYTGRYKKLDPVIRSAFNLPVMTRFAVGSVWNTATAQEQQSLTSAFSDFTVANYATQFASYHGEELTVIDEKPVSGGIIVETTIKPKDKDAVALNYLMRPDDKGTYRIVDIFLNGSISQLAARRAEFNSIAQRDGIPGLVNTLDERSKKMGPG